MGDLVVPDSAIENPKVLEGSIYHFGLCVDLLKLKKSIARLFSA